MTSTLQQNVRRLAIEHPALQRMAVQAIWKSLGQHGTYTSKEGAATFQEILSSKHKVVVEEAVRQLIAFVPKPGLSTSDAAGLLLASLSTSDTATVPPLVRGLVDLFKKQAEEGSQPAAAWQAHLLSKTLCAHPEASYQLLQCIQQLLVEINEYTEPPPLWTHLRPFLSFALLDPGPQGERLVFALSLHSILCNFSCQDSPILELLTFHTPCLPLMTAPQRNFAVQAASNNINLVRKATTGINASSDQGLQREVLQGIRQLCHELKSQGLPGHLLQRQLGSHLYWEDDEEKLALEVALLAHNNASPADPDLMDMVSEYFGYDGLGKTTVPLILGLYLSPIMHTLVFDAPPLAKEKANHLLHKLRLPETDEDDSAAKELANANRRVRFERTDLRWSLCALNTGCCSLLRNFFNSSGGEAVGWLQSLQASMRQAANSRSTASRTAAAPQSAALPSEAAQPSLSEPFVMALPALLCHPEAAVQVEAARTLAQAVKAVPLLGISFLPLIVYHLQNCTSPGEEGRAEVESALLEAIPAMAVHSAALPFVNRALTQLPPLGSPEAEQARLMRLRAQLWLGSGHGFNALSDALLGTGGEIPSKQQRESVELRVTRAQCLLDVCAQDVGKGYQLLEGIEGCLGSDLEEEAALAFEALALLVERDGLKFQKAWAAVQRRAPTLPDQAWVAAAWLALLGHAHRDAEKHPEQFAGFHDTLWQATEHPSARVRAAAYAALARCPIETLELLELAKPLQQYSRLLLQERDASALAACEGLVTAALSYEHARRRRYVGVAAKGPTAATQKAEDPLLRRMTKVLPKQLCRAAVGSSGGAASPGALLLCWAPPAPSADAYVTPAEHAREAAAAYRARLAEIAADGPATAGNCAANSDLVFHSWKRFLSRWMGALKAASQSDGSASQGEAATTAAGEEVWAAIQQVMEEGTAPAPDEAVYAAGALCSLLHGRARHTCSAILNRLTSAVSSPRTHAASTRAYLLALGAAAQGGETSDAIVFLGNALSTDADASMWPATAEALGATCVSESSEEDKAVGETLTRLLRLLCLRSAFFRRGLLRALQWQVEPSDMPEQSAEITGIVKGVAKVLHAMETSRSDEVLRALFGTCCTGLVAMSLRAADVGLSSEGVCVLLPALVTTMLSMGLADGSHIQKALSGLRGVLTARHLPGQVVGAAATSLGCLVAGLAPDQAHAEAQRSVDAMLAAIGNAPRLAQSGGARSGIAAGLAALLGAPHQLPGVPPAVGPPALLASPQTADATKQALQALEALATKEADPQVRRAAAWALADAAVAARGGPSPGAPARPGASADARALQSLPEDGAMRSLLQYALNAATQSGAQSCSAVVLHCLAAAEKLPPVNVGALCSSFLQRADATPSLQEAAVALALRHSETTGDFLEGLFQQSSFSSLSLRLHMQLLTGLGGAVNALSATRSSLLLSSVPQLCCSTGAHQPGADSTGDEGLQLQTAAWEGLRSLLRGNEVSGSGSIRGLTNLGDVSDAVYQAMQGLFALLPSPPATLPGEEVDMEACNAKAQQTSRKGDAADAQLDCHSDASILSLWSAVLQCLKAADKDKVLSLLPCSEGSPAGAGQVFIRAMLVRWGALPLTELQPCRMWCIRSTPDLAGPLLATVARSTAAMPHTQKQQLLMECLDLVTVCEHPAQAFTMAALLAATWRAQLHSDPGETHVTAQSPPAAAAALPYALPSLLEHPQWRPAADAAAHRLAAIVEHAAGSTMVQCEVLGRGALPVPILELARACIIGMRNLLTPPAWKHVSAMALHEP